MTQKKTESAHNRASLSYLLEEIIKCGNYNAIGREELLKRKKQGAVANDY